MNTQLTDNEALELKALIAPSDEELAKIENLEEVKRYLLSLTKLYLSSNSYSEKTLPKSIGKLMQLTELVVFGSHRHPEKFVIENWEKFKNIPSYKNYFEQFKFIIFPETLGNLINLETLHIEHGNIKKLPNSIGNLKSLKELFIFDCFIEELPESISNLKKLEKLDLVECVYLKRLPKNIVNLTKLIELNLSRNQYDKYNDTFDITSILQEVSQLTQIKKLYLDLHTNIICLPENIINLTQLTHLSLYYSINLKELPKNIGNFTQLMYLNLDNCKTLNELPESICNLKQLQGLSLRNCKGIKAFPENFGALENLEELYCDYKNIDKLPLSFTKLKNLKENYLQLALNKINEIKKDDDKSKLLDILLCVLKIREELIIKYDFFDREQRELIKYEQFVAHYTRTDIAIKLLEKDEQGNSKQNPFQMGSIASVNDPSEGKVIFDYFNELNVLKNNNVVLKPVSTLATFVGCFTFNHDSLNQFRLYGKEQGKEATGISIVLRNDFFTSNHSNSSENKKEDEQKYIDNKLPLYRCIYLDPKSRLQTTYIELPDLSDNSRYGFNEQYHALGYCEPYFEIAHRNKLTFYKELGNFNSPKEWEEYEKLFNIVKNKVLKQLGKIEENIILLFKDINKIDNKIIDGKEKISSFVKKNINNYLNKNDKIISKEEVEKEKYKEQLIKTVSFILMPLSYMVKHSAYEEEQECRIFKFLSFDNPNNEIKTDIDNKRMYVEYQPIDNCIEKIYLSPYAEKYADMFRALSNGRVEVRSSDNPFR